MVYVGVCWHLDIEVVLAQGVEFLVCEWDCHVGILEEVVAG